MPGVCCTAQHPVISLGGRCQEWMRVAYRAERHFGHSRLCMLHHLLPEHQAADDGHSLTTVPWSAMNALFAELACL